MENNNLDRDLTYTTRHKALSIIFHWEDDMPYQARHAYIIAAPFSVTKAPEKSTAEKVSTLQKQGKSSKSSDGEQKAFGSWSAESGSAKDKEKA